MEHNLLLRGRMHLGMASTAAYKQEVAAADSMDVMGSS